MHVVFKKNRKYVFRLKHRFGLFLRILLNTRLFVHLNIFQCILVGLVYVQTKEDAKNRGRLMIYRKEQIVRPRGTIAYEIVPHGEICSFLYIINRPRFLASSFCWT